MRLPAAQALDDVALDKHIDARQTSRTMWTCSELIDEFLMDYLDGCLSPEEKLCFEEHLAVCSDCQAYLESYQQTVRLGKDVLTSSDTELMEVPETLVAAILAARR